MRKMVLLFGSLLLLGVVSRTLFADYSLQGTGKDAGCENIMTGEVHMNAEKDDKTCEQLLNNGTAKWFPLREVVNKPLDQSTNDKR